MVLPEFYVLSSMQFAYNCICGLILMRCHMHLVEHDDGTLHMDVTSHILSAVSAQSDLHREVDPCRFILVSSTVSETTPLSTFSPNWGSSYLLSKHKNRCGTMGWAESGRECIGASYALVPFYVLNCCCCLASFVVVAHSANSVL